MEENKESNKNKPLSNTVLYIGIGIFICGFIYAIFNRTSQDFMKYSFYISGVTAIIFLSIRIFYFFKKGISKPTKGDLFMLISVLIALVLIGPTYYAVGVAIKDLYFWIQSPKITKEWSIPIVLGITVSVGFFLFYFRLRARSIYGLTEAIVGLAIAMQKTSIENSEELTKSSFYLAILTASIYLFVRGLDNIHQGMTKEPYDYYARKIYAKFTSAK